VARRFSRWVRRRPGQAGRARGLLVSGCSGGGPAKPSSSSPTHRHRRRHWLASLTAPSPSPVAGVGCRHCPEVTVTLAPPPPHPPHLVTPALSTASPSPPSPSVRSSDARY